MICKKDKFKYKIPAFSNIVSAFIRGKDYDTHIQKILPNEMLSFDFDYAETPIGAPKFFAIINQELWLYPIPNSDIEVKVYYAPPIMEF